MKDRLIEIERRLAQAERRARLSSGGLIFISVVILIGAGVRPGSTETEGTTLQGPVRIVSPSGKLIAEIAGDQGAYLVLHNPSGKNECIVSAGEGESGITLLPPGGSGKGSLKLTSNDLYAGVLGSNNGGYVSLEASDAGGSLTLLGTGPSVCSIKNGDMVLTKSGKKAHWP